MQTDANWDGEAEFSQICHVYCDFILVSESSGRGAFFACGTKHERGEAALRIAPRMSGGNSNFLVMRHRRILAMRIMCSDTFCCFVTKRRYFELH